MDADELLRQVTIPSPCPARWGSMPGDDRVRSCPACRKEVRNFEALAAEEVASLITARGNDLCGRLVRGGDGRILTAGGLQFTSPVMLSDFPAGCTPCDHLPSGIR